MLTDRLIRWVAERLAIAQARDRIQRLTRSVDLAEVEWIMLSPSLAGDDETIRRVLAEDHMKLTRILISGDQQVRVTGTEEQINAACARMAQRTKTCVTIAVIVGHYHRKGCDERPAGGIQMVGN